MDELAGLLGMTSGWHEEWIAQDGLYRKFWQERVRAEKGKSAARRALSCMNRLGRMVVMPSAAVAGFLLRQLLFYAAAREPAHVYFLQKYKSAFQPE